MGVYPEDYDTFANLNAVGLLVMSLSTNALNGILLSAFENEIMLKPGLCFFKSFADCITTYFIFC